MAALPPQPVDINGKPFTRGTSEQELNQWNEALRSSDMYQDFLRTIGKVDTGAGVKLSRDEQAGLEQKLKASGIQIPTKDFQIDQGGNLNQGNRLVRNVAIIAGTALGGYFAAPYIGSALGMGGGTTAAGGTITGEGLGTGALLAGEGGVAGLGGAAGGLGTTAGSGVLASGLGTTAATGGGTAAITGGGGTLSTIGKILGKTAPIIGGLGKAVGSATDAAGKNRLTQEELALQANRDNTSGQSAFENELMNRSRTEADERKDALKNIYRQSFASNRVAGPNNARGLTPLSPEYQAALKNLTTQGSTQLSQGATYGTQKMAPLKPYTPINVQDVQGSTNTKKGTLETIGDWVGPGLSIYEKIASAYGR